MMGEMLRRWYIGWLLCAGISWGVEDGGGDVRSAWENDPPGAPVGVRPYELEWAGRQAPNHTELVDFEDLRGWRTRSFDGAEAQLMRSRQELLFGQYTGRVDYQGRSAQSRFLIEPPEPLPIPVQFTGVNLWVRGNTWSWDPNQTSAMVGIAVVVRDATKRTYRIPLDPNNHDYWFLSHRTCVSPDGRSAAYVPAEPRMELPAEFVGIEVSGVTNARTERLHFDALQFYVMEYPPLQFAPLPDTRPWPTTPDTILPLLKREATVTVSCDDAACAWTVEGDETIRFRYVPQSGTLGDLSVEAGGQQFFPCWNGGVTFEAGGALARPGDRDIVARCLEFGPADSGCTALWEITQGANSWRYRYSVRVKGKSVMVDVTADGRDATRLDIGLAKGLADTKTVYFPYLTYGNDWPKVVCSTGGDRPLFLWAAPDYFNSDASELFGAPGLHDSQCIGYTGGALYKPTTAGIRNPLRERIFVNVSSDVQEVLPEIPNPACDTGHIAKEYLWCNIGAVHQRERLSRFKAYGIDKFIACHHEVGWREGGESFTLRDRPADSIGEDRLREYGDFVRSLGYRFGTYTNYVDFAPVNANWNEDDVCLDPDGRWQRAWPRCYALKPLRAAELEAHYAPLINARYGTTAQYCDVHTAYTPWGRTDYDARTPGAGMFRTQFDAFARLLWNESTAHQGPVFSEGNYHWFYAGIVDGNYATIMPYGEGWKLDPLVDFDLLKMHPKMTDFGMGFGEMYFGTSPEWRAAPGRLNPWFDRLTAATMAFGHIGFLTYEWGFEATVKGYYLLQALQQRYAMVEVRRIGYSDGQAILDTSAAIAVDAHKRRQVYVEYDNDLRVWVNLHSELDWEVAWNGVEYQLPPCGFLAHRPDDILAYSARVNGQPRHEHVDCADYRYLDGRGTLARTASVIASGAVAIKPDGDRQWWVIPTPDCGPVSIARHVLDVSPGSRYRAQAVNLAGASLGDVEVRHGPSHVTIMPHDDAAVVKYRLVVESQDGPVWTVEDLPDYLLPGETRRIRARVAGIGDAADPHPVYVPDVGPPARGEVVVTSTAPGAMQAEFSLSLPVNSPSHGRAWFRCHGGDDGSDCWIDVPVRPPVDIRFVKERALVRADRPVPLQVDVTSNLRRQHELAISLSVDGQQLERRTADVWPGACSRCAWHVAPVSAPSSQVLTLSATWPGGVFTEKVRMRRTPEDWVVADLSQQSYHAGQCLRGEAEAPYDHAGTLAMVVGCRETVGDRSLSGLHMHPPYAGKTGYVFASFSVDLPAGHPRLDFALGFRRGSTTMDGCLFRVQVVDGRDEVAVFEEQYQRLDAWADRSVDLTPFAGRTVTLKLITDAGPADNTHSDWALWGAPRVVMADPMVRLEFERE